MRTKIGVEGLDALIEGGVPRGAAVLVAGEAGSGKSVLCMQFILAGIRDGEPGVYATADHPNRVLEAASAIGWDLRGAVEDGYARVVQIGDDPSLTAPGGAPSVGESAASAVAAAVAEVHAERVVIDPPLVGGAEAGNGTADYIATLVRSTLRETHCTTLITGQRLFGAPGLTRLGIEEQIVDGIVDLGFAQRDGHRRRVAAVRSMHGTQTDLDDHVFEIVPGHGLVIEEG